MTKRMIIVAAVAACGGGADALPHSNGKGPAPFDPGTPYYCPGVGNVLVEEGDTRVELVEYAGI